MQLKVKYQNNEIRVINLLPDFFDREQYAKFGSPEKKAMDMAYQMGSKPYHITLHLNGRTVMDKKLPGNEPLLYAESVNIDEKEIKKSLRKEFRNQDFTHILKVSEGLWKELKQQRKKAA